MPYKSKEAQREAQRNWVRQKRTNEGSTSGKVEGSTKVEMFNGKPRYITMTDGQVLDRCNQPKPNKHLPGMEACNRVDKADLSHGMSKQKRLAMILRALDKEVTGLDGKRVNLQSMVRYGVNGPTLKEIQAKL